MPGFSDLQRPLARFLFAYTLLLGGLGTPFNAGAQLISPGKVSTAHKDLEGMGNCTKCHQLRTRGVDGERCLSCHIALSARIEERTGYHGQLQDRNCGSCHKEHLGRDFKLVRMDPDTFPHSAAGFDLVGAHSQADCRACHTPDLVVAPVVLEEMKNPGGLARTYLGLDPACASCHRRENPHREQFAGRDCGVCHTEMEWEDPSDFDHTQTSFPLQGRHGSVECAGCHVPEQLSGGSESIRYTPVEASDCSACHESQHPSQLRGRCDGCHVPNGWLQVNRTAMESTFDHTSTDFELVGAHGRLECAACHQGGRASRTGIELVFPAGVRGRSYPVPEFGSCVSCHVDQHQGVFEDKSCDTCHGPDFFDPPDYDRAQHEMEARFLLTGAHEVTPCSACHEVGEGDGVGFVFRFEDPGSCLACHQPDDPHEGAFRTDGCDGCHSTSAFLVDPFDHRLLNESGWTGVCVDCHADEDPHVGQFTNRACNECHETEAFSIPVFDHETTSFPLEGAHDSVPCSDCHKKELGPRGQSMVRYRPLEQTCTACHGGSV